MSKELKRNMKKAFCMLLAAATLSSGMELPVNAAELTNAACEEKLHEETESETLVEEVLEEVPEETAQTIDTEEADGEIEAAETPLQRRLTLRKQKSNQKKTQHLRRKSLIRKIKRTG